MSESYITTLSAEAKTRYEEKIKLIGGLDPYSSNLGKEIGDIPPVDAADMLSYLVLQTSYSTSQQFKARKSLQAYNQFISGWVKDVKTWLISGKYLVKGKGTIRISKHLEVHVGTEEDIVSHIPHWHHVDCVMPDLYHGGVAPEQITNFSNLGIDAKRVLQESFQAFVERSERKKRKSPEIEPPDKKKTKMSTEELTALTAQSVLLWTYQHDLRIGLKPDEVYQLLDANHQSMPRGDNIFYVDIPVLDVVADGMAFGALSPCPTCGGQLTIYSHSYKCNGNTAEGSKCTYSTNDPARSNWIVPKDLKRHRFLKSFKFKPGKRIFPKDGGPSTSIYPTRPKPSYPDIPPLPLLGEASCVPLPVTGALNLSLPTSEISLKPPLD